MKQDETLPFGAAMPAFENLRIHMVHGDNSKTAAFVSCKIITEAGALFLNSMALVRGANGLYLSFPSRKRDGQPVKGFEDYYYMERGLKELVQATAIEEFKARCAEMGVDAEKASAPLPPGMHADEEEEHHQPREPREQSREPRGDRAPREPREPREAPQRQPMSNESRPVNGGVYGNRGGGGGGYRGNNGGGYEGNRGGGQGGGAYRSNGGGYDRSPNGGGGGYRGSNGSSQGGGGYRGNGGGYDNRGGGQGYRGEDFGNRAGGRGGYDNGNRNNYGFPTGPSLANRPLSSRFNPYTGNNDLQIDKSAPVEGPRKNGQDEGAE
jgi:DNA-binding cell septation regulator SpoVG